MYLETCRNDLINGRICNKYNFKNLNINYNEDIKKKLMKISYTFNLLSFFINNELIDYNKPFLGKLQEEIYNTTNEKLSKKQIFNLLKTLSKYKNELKTMTLNKNISSKYLMKIGNTGLFSKLLGWYPDTPFTTKALDIIDLLLDLAGFIPGIGIPIDAAGAIFSMIRGRYIDGIFSVINMIPIVGSFIGTPGKYIRKFMRYGKKAGKAYDRYQDLGTAKDILYNEDDGYNEEYY